MEDRAWRQCLPWFKQIGIFMEEDPIHLPSSTIHDLHARLKDGVLLCRLLYLIDPSLIESSDICPSTQQKSRYIWTRNIKLFKTVCSHKLKLFNLFEDRDLINKRNLDAVLRTLSNLSQTERAKKKATPFSFSSDQQHTKNAYISPKEKEINVIESIPDDFKFEISQYQNIQKKYVELPEADSIVPQAPTLQVDPDDDHSCSIGAFENLIAGERKYLLNVLIFGLKIKGRLMGYFGEQHCNRIFYKFEELINIHTKLFKDMCEAFPRNYVALYKAFNDIREHLFIYCEYAASFQKSTQRLRKFRNDPHQAEYITEIETEYNVNIESNVLFPPRTRSDDYVMILQSLLQQLIADKAQEDTAIVMKIMRMMKRLADIKEQCASDEELKSNFNDENFGGLHKLREGFVEFTKCGRLLLDDEITFSHMKSIKKKVGTMFIFEEGITLFQNTRTRDLRVMGGKEAEELNTLDFLEFVKTEDIAIEPVFGASFGAEHDFSPTTTLLTARPFTLKKPVTRESIVIHPTSQNRAKDVELTLNHMRFLYWFNKRSVHKFDPSWYDIELNKTKFCELCFNALSGSYGQYYSCMRCDLECHGYCMVIADLLPCNTSRSRLHEVWWKGEMSRNDTITALKDSKCEEGSFLLRWSPDEKNLVLSVCDAVHNIQHVLLTSDEGKEFGIKNATHPKSFKTLAELVKHFSENNIYESYSEINALLSRATISFTDKYGFNEVDLNFLRNKSLKSEK